MQEFKSSRPATPGSSGSAGERPMSREMALIQVKLFLQTFYDREFPIAEVENGMLIAWPFAQIILEPEASRQRYERNPQSFLPETVLFLAAALKAPGMAAIQEALRVVGGGEKCRA